MYKSERFYFTVDGWEIRKLLTIAAISANPLATSRQTEILL